MVWLGFWASLAGSLAWPAVVVTTIVVFRQELLGLLSRLSQVSVAGVEFQLEKAERAVDNLPPLPKVTPAPAPVAVGTAAADAKAWSDVEKAVHRLWGVTKPSAKSDLSAVEKLRVLSEQGVVDRQTAAVIAEMASIYLGPDLLTLGQSARLASSAEKVASRLSDLAGRLTSSAGAG